MAEGDISFEFPSHAVRHDHVCTHLLSYSGDLLHATYLIQHALFF